MSKKQKFIQMVEQLIEGNMPDLVGVHDEGLEYFKTLKESKDKSTSGITENGQRILTYMRGQEGVSFKAAQIAEGLFVSPRAVTGAVRKLITDGYVTKDNSTGSITYSLTETGATVPFGEN